MSRPYFAIVWFTVWGAFQAFVVTSMLVGTWERPEVFPARAYEAFIFPDLFFIPLYFVAAGLLIRQHWMGTVVAFVAGGGVVYAMLYVIALSGFSGTANLVADGLFLVCTLVSLWQVARRSNPRLAV